jgi:DNA-binding winged helix-turn-helix (wHTH) protein/tetratricopeptide (TPR) repeat protein
MTTSSSTTAPPLRVLFDRFEIDEAEARLSESGQPVHLAPKPFALLCALARTPHTLITKSALLDDVWGHQFVSESVLKTSISDLRAALQDDAKQPRYIETVSRRGYRFIGTVSEAAKPAASQVALAAPAPVNGRQSAPTPASIGRTDVLARLKHGWGAAATGRRQIVWVSGEAGVGKTTVIERFMREVGEARCAYGHCVEQYGAGEPHLPVLEALTDLSRRDPSLVELIRAVAPTWLFQLPWLASQEEREALRRELSGAGQARMLREMGELLDRYTEDRPLLLVTEDLHWSDHATVQLMDYVARRRSPARLLWLGSFRVTELIAADHPLATVRQELRLHGLGAELPLDDFTEAEVGEYVASRVPSLATEPALVRALHDRTDGLPLFVAGVIDDLVARPAPQGDPHARLAAMAIPDTLSGVIERYVEELTPEQRSLLEAASVCGVQFRLSTVACVLDVDAMASADACTEVARGQRWLKDLALATNSPPAESGYVFRHALYREVLYKRVGRLARIELHRKVAAALERERAQGLNVGAAELATHLDLGREPMAALGYYAEAAESALLHFSPAQTLTLTERAMALLPQVEPSAASAALEMTLATLRGTAAMQVKGFTSPDVKEAFARALSLLEHVPEHPLRGLFLSVLGLAYATRGEHEQAAAIARRSEALWQSNGDRTALVCACLVHGLLERDRGRPSIAREWLEKGIRAVEELDASTSRAVFVADAGVMMMGLVATELVQLGLIEQGRQRIEAACARALTLREPAPRQAAFWLAALFEVRVGNPQGVADAAERLARLQDEYDGPEGKAAALWFRGWAEAQLGEPRSGHRLIREGYERVARCGMRAYAGETLGYAAEALILAGDWVAARKEIAEAMQCAEATGDRSCRPRLLMLEARIADALGERRRAHDALLEALTEARTQEATWLELLAHLALCERGDATVVEMAALREVVEGLTEGLDMPAVARARAHVTRRRAPALA